MILPIMIRQVADSLACDLYRNDSRPYSLEEGRTPCFRDKIRVTSVTSSRAKLSSSVWAHRSLG